MFVHRFRAAAVAASFVLLTVPARADTTGLIRGTVQNGAAPAAGLTVTLRGEGTARETTTGPGGAFVFARVPFGRYVVGVRRGSNDVTQPVTIEADSVVSVSLDVGLKEIGKAQSSYVRGAGATPVSVNTINREALATLPDNQSLDKVITTLPGIARFSYNEPIAHGFHGLAYEIDGVPLPLATTSNFSEVIDPRTIDSLEVFTGAFPAEFGGSRQGAVVNVISHRADLHAPESGSLTLGGGSYGDLSSSLAESTTLFANTRVFLNINDERSSRGIDSPTYVPIHDASNQGNEFIRSVTDIGAHDVLAVDLSNNVAKFQIPINTIASSTDPIVSPASTDDVQLESDQFFNAVFTHNAADGNAYTQVAPWYRYDRVRYLGDFANDLAGGVDGLQQDRHSGFIGLRLDHFHVFGPNAVKIGVDESVENFAGTETIAYDEAADGTTIPTRYFNDSSAQRGTQFGAYVQDKWTPTRFVSVLAGLRLDRSTGYVNGGQVSPRIEFNGQLDPHDIVHAYYGRLYAAPFIEDTRRAAVVLSGASNAQPYDLAPEHDSYDELGLAHTFSPGTRATVNFWKRDVRDVLDTTQLANTPIFAVFNNTIGIAKGVEARVEGTLRSGDTFFVSSALSKALAGGVSGSTFLFAPSTNPTDVTLAPEDHDQTFNATVGYTKRLGADRAYFASLEPQYATGYPVQFESGPGRLPPHLEWNASFGRDAGRGARSRLGFDATFENFTNSVYLLKVNNGFNTTQWGEGFRAGLRISLPF